MYQFVTLGRGWLQYIASAHMRVNVVEEIYQCCNKNWVVFYVKFVLSTKNYGYACNIIILRNNSNSQIVVIILSLGKDFYS